MSSDYDRQLRDVEEEFGMLDPAAHPETTKHEVIQELAGKTIEHIAVIRQDPEVFGDVLYVHFTDGTTLRLEAGMSDVYGLLRWKVT